MKAKLLRLISREVEGICHPLFWKNVIQIIVYAAAIYLASHWKAVQLMSE